MAAYQIPEPWFYPDMHVLFQGRYRHFSSIYSGFLVSFVKREKPDEGKLS
jgi:uncharacterized protein YfdQ (DUF2303 family)